MTLENILDSAKIRLDIGCGASLQNGWVGMDRRAFPDYPPERFIQHDIEDVPWPLEDSCASVILASHIMEHVSPVVHSLQVSFTAPSVVEDVKLVKRSGIISVMDEMWRVLEHEGQVQVAGPYGWSHGFIQDPTHTKPLNETLFAYFTPKDWTGVECPLYEIYKPRPWTWVQPPQYSTGGNILVVLETMKQ